MNRTCGDESTVANVVASCRRHARKEFTEELGIAGRSFDTNNICDDLGGGSAVSKSRPVNFEVWKNGDVIVTVRHRFQLCVLEVRRKFDG